MNHKEDNKLKEGTKSPTLKNPYRSPDFGPKWDLGVWGYVILGVLFLLAVYFLKWDIIPVAIGVILLIGFWIFWFGVIKRSLWELIVFIFFLIYLLAKTSSHFK